MKYIAVDFDGTCVTHEYPKIGKDIGAVPVLKDLVVSGHKLLLNTMRSGLELIQAERWFIDNEIPLYGVNYNPTQSSWTKSPKVYANLYIDDAALGCPLVHKYNTVKNLMTRTQVTYPNIKYIGSNDRPYVDWDKVKQLLIEQKYL